MSNSWENICVYDAKLNGDEFVGIRIKNDKPQVYFPVGYRKPQTEREQKKDILNLISVLSVYSNKKESFQTQSAESQSFPIHAYIGVFTYYINYGYFSETESIYKKGTSGIINWNKTIKRIQPQISKKKPIYLDFIVRKTRLNEDNLITQIHKYCVEESYKKIGCIFSSIKPDAAPIKFNEALFSSVLLSKISNTFNEKHLILFRQMLDIVRFLGKNKKNQNMLFGTNDFEYVWEKLIDEVYGVSEEKKQDFYPRTKWILDNFEENEVGQECEKSALRPDTIMLFTKKTEEAVFILDAKYYRYGAMTKPNPAYLPGSASINKQFTYAEYVSTLEKYKHSKIYNAFIMPYKADFPEGKFDLTPKRIGIATGEWKKEGKTYEKIYGLLLDIKSLMYRHPRQSTDDMRILAEIIDPA